MKDLRDKDIKDIFKPLSKEEAPVDKSAWEKINQGIKKPGFWDLGINHFNSYVLVITVAVITSISYWIYTSENKEDLPSHQINYQVPKETISTHLVPSSNSMLTEEMTRTDKTTNQQEQPTDRQLELKPSDKTSEAVIVEPNNFNTPTDTIKKDTIVSQPKLVNNVLDTPSDTTKKYTDLINKDSIPVSSPTPKKSHKTIIIVEEDTVIQVDTVFKKKRFRRKDD